MSSRRVGNKFPTRFIRFSCSLNYFDNNAWATSCPPYGGFKFSSIKVK
ncbi:MAG: hypothetical protein IKX14_03740 [Neisseriaceae bacterium]|nr:hypothetical protein [Neisseriaceae bacterium]